MRLTLILLLIIFSNKAIGQKVILDTIFIDLMAVYGPESLILEEKAYPFEQDSIHIDVFKFYLSNIKLLKEQETVWTQKNSYHLIDYDNPASNKLYLIVPNKLEFNQLQFDLGIDSSTNVSGVMGGALDPTKGMYWTWQSGFINFKLEGNTPQCPTRLNTFQFHLGGYMIPMVQRVQIAIDATDNIALQIDVAKFLTSINLAEQHTVMSPSKQAQELSKIASTIFTVYEQD